MWQLILLGAVQGITEFLPISSDGHLTLIEHMLGIDQNQLGLTIWLHLGTLAATCLVYRREVAQILRGDWRLALMLVIAMLPAAVVGLLFRSFFEAVFSSIRFLGLFFWMTAAALLVGERLFRSSSRVREQVTWADAVIIGLAQALAILPGVSRSGMTISAGIACGLRRIEAARFSFLLAIPTVAGAVLVEGYETFQEGLAFDPWELVAGTLTSFVVGVAALKSLLALLRHYPMHCFAVYCVLLGAGTLVYQFVATP